MDIYAFEHFQIAVEFMYILRFNHVFKNSEFGLMFKEFNRNKKTFLHYVQKGVNLQITVITAAGSMVAPDMFSMSEETVRLLHRQLPGDRMRGKVS